VAPAVASVALFGTVARVFVLTAAPAADVAAGAFGGLSGASYRPMDLHHRRDFQPAAKVAEGHLWGAGIWTKLVCENTASPSSHGNQSKLTSICVSSNAQFVVGPTTVEQSVASASLANAHRFFFLSLQC